MSSKNINKNKLKPRTTTNNNIKDKKMQIFLILPRLRQFKCMRKFINKSYSINTGLVIIVIYQLI
jgi:hypothetical protein